MLSNFLPVDKETQRPPVRAARYVGISSKSMWTSWWGLLLCKYCVFGPSLVEKNLPNLSPLLFPAVSVCVFVCVGYLPHQMLLEKHPNIHQNSKTAMTIRFHCFCMTALFWSVFSPFKTQARDSFMCMPREGSDKKRDMQTKSRLQLVPKPYDAIKFLSLIGAFLHLR